MKKKQYKDVLTGESYIYISPTGAWVKDAWVKKGAFEEYFVPGSRWVWVK